MKCPNCGNDLYNNPEICINCGQKLNDPKDDTKKSKLNTMILWAIGGLFGAHRYYLGHYNSAIIMTFCIMLSFLVIPGIIVFIWWIIDIFSICSGKLIALPKQFRHVNKFLKGTVMSIVIIACSYSTVELIKQTRLETPVFKYKHEDKYAVQTYKIPKDSFNKEKFLKLMDEKRTSVYPEFYTTGKHVFVYETDLDSKINNFLKNKSDSIDLLQMLDIFWKQKPYFYYEQTPTHLKYCEINGDTQYHYITGPGRMVSIPIGLNKKTIITSFVFGEFSHKRTLQRPTNSITAVSACDSKYSPNNPISIKLEKDLNDFYNESFK